MKFAIENQLPVFELADTFNVKVNCFAGDADFYSDFTVKGFQRGKDEDLLEKFIELLKASVEFYPNGRGGDVDYSYSRVPDWLSWFSEEGFEFLEESWSWYSSNQSYSDALKLSEEVEAFYAKTAELFKARGLDFEYPSWPIDGNSFFDSHGEVTVDTFEIYYVDSDLQRWTVSIL